MVIATFMGYLVVVTYLAAFIIGALALYSARGSRFLYAITMASTFGCLTFAALYAGYVAGEATVIPKNDAMWLSAHVNSAAVLVGFHTWRLRCPYE